MILYKTVSFATLLGGNSFGIEAGAGLLLGSVFPSLVMLYFMADVYKLVKNQTFILINVTMITQMSNSTDIRQIYQIYRLCLGFHCSKYSEEKVRH